MTTKNNNKAGSPELTDIDKAMETARQKQQEEMLNEQVRMERLHVATMALSGLLAKSHWDERSAAERAVSYADELLKAVAK